MERFEQLMGLVLSYLGVSCFPEWLQIQLSQKGPLTTEAIEYLKSQSVICRCAAEAPASWLITERVYNLGRPRVPVEGQIDEWIAWSLGGQALFNRLPKAGQWLGCWLASRPNPYNIIVRDLGGSCGSYALRALETSDGTFPKSWLCVDCDRSALEEGRNRVWASGISDILRFENANFLSSSSFPAEAADQADLLVLIGILCGMTPEKATQCLKRIKPHAKHGGEIFAATLLKKSFEENPLVYQLLAKLGWQLRPKSVDEVIDVFRVAKWEILGIYSEREGGDGEYAIVHARRE